MVESLMSLQSEPSMLMNLMAFMLGLVVNIIQKMMEHKISFSEYLNEHKGRTLLSGGALMTSFAGIAMAYPGASLVVYFFSAYMIDSMANKAKIMKL